MKFAIGTRSTGRFREILHGILEPGQATAAMERRIGQLVRQGLAVVLSALMILVPMGQGAAFAQSAPMPSDGQQSAPAAADNSQPAPQAQPLTADQLDQLVAPVALYPDALVAQVLAAATYPTQVVEANRWLKAQGSAPAAQIAASANTQNWDASVKALTAFPTVLDQMDHNLQWTTDLGNAYYNQPQDVMDAVQAMRQKAQAAGQLQNTQQQTVATDNGQIVIAPANPSVVYVPVYNPWTIWGGPFAPFPGYYYYPPPGIYFGGLGIGFGVGIGIGLWGGFGWGWGHWGMGWHNHAVFFNHGSYYSHSRTVINRGFNRPGGPGRGFGARGAYGRPGGGFNRPGGSMNRSAGRPGGNYGHSGGVGRPGGTAAHSGGNYGRPGGGPAAGRASVGGGHPSGGGGHAGGGHPSGGGGHSGGHGGGGHK